MAQHVDLVHSSSVPAMSVAASGVGLPALRLSGPRAGLPACLVHGFAVLALVAHGVTLAVPRVPRPVTRAWATAAAGVVAGLVPLAVRSAGQSEQVSWIDGPVRLRYFLVVAVVGVVCARAPLEARSTGCGGLPPYAWIAGGGRARPAEPFAEERPARPGHRGTHAGSAVRHVER